MISEYICNSLQVEAWVVIRLVINLRIRQIQAPREAPKKDE